MADLLGVFEVFWRACNPLVTPFFCVTLKKCRTSLARMAFLAGRTRDIKDLAESRAVV
jgi:hypothetical protein